MGYFRDNIERIGGYQPGYQPKQADVVKLNTNENPYPPSPAALKVLREFNPERLRRYPDPLGSEFRQAAGELNGVPAEWIMCCNGGDDLLRIAFTAFCDEDRPVAYPVPTYSLYPVLANIENCKAIEVQFDDQYNLPAKLAKTAAALTVVCNPNAPSGSFIRVEELASLADELSGVLLIDEAYVDFAERNCLELVRDFNNVIVLRSLSKGYSLAGLRFGYAIAQPELIKGLIKVKDSYNVDALAIAVATAAIKDQRYFKDNVEKIKAERARLTVQLRTLGFYVPGSQANFVLAQVKNGSLALSRVEGAAEIYQNLTQRNIYVRYFPYPRLDDKLRISIGTPEQDDRLVSALKEILAG